MESKTQSDDDDVQVVNPPQPLVPFVLSIEAPKIQTSFRCKEKGCGARLGSSQMRNLHHRAHRRDWISRGKGRRGGLSRMDRGEGGSRGKGKGGEGPGEEGKKDEPDKNRCTDCMESSDVIIIRPCSSCKKGFCTRCLSLMCSKCPGGAILLCHFTPTCKMKEGTCQFCGEFSLNPTPSQRRKLSSLKRRPSFGSKRPGLDRTTRLTTERI